MVSSHELRTERATAVRMQNQSHLRIFQVSSVVGNFFEQLSCKERMRFLRVDALIWMLLRGDAQSSQQATPYPATTYHETS